ncbi:MAG: ricin-type beta-trefoil lectin domain protein [Gammaproteobacteria bacterium]
MHFFSVSNANAALVVGLGDKCMDVAGGNTANSTPVVIFQCNGGSNQQWNVVDGQIIGIGNKCLDIPGSNTADGTQLTIFTCNGGSNQRWVVQ